MLTVEAYGIAGMAVVESVVENFQRWAGTSGLIMVLMSTTRMHTQLRSSTRRVLEYYGLSGRNNLVFHHYLLPICKLNRVERKLSLRYEAK